MVGVCAIVVILLLVGWVLGQVLLGVCEIVIILLSVVSTASAEEVAVAMDLCFSSHHLKNLWNNLSSLLKSFWHFIQYFSPSFSSSFSHLNCSFLR